MSINIGFFDLIEINEAFAATSIAVQRSLKIDPNKLNIVFSPILCLAGITYFID